MNNRIISIDSHVEEDMNVLGEHVLVNNENTMKMKDYLDWVSKNTAFTVFAMAWLLLIMLVFVLSFNFSDAKIKADKEIQIEAIKAGLVQNQYGKWVRPE